MGMVETKINNVMLGTIQNGSFVPIGKIDNVATFEDDDQVASETNNSIKLRDDFVYKCTFSMSEREIKNLELRCIYGWKNKMPFRKRLLKKVKRKWARYCIYSMFDF